MHKEANAKSMVTRCVNNILLLFIKKKTASNIVIRGFVITLYMKSPSVLTKCTSKVRLIKKSTINILKNFILSEACYKALQFSKKNSTNRRTLFFEFSSEYIIYR